MHDDDRPGFTPRKLMALELLHSGKSVQETAEILGLHRSTISRYLNDDPLFRAQYNAEVDHTLEQTKAQTRSVMNEALAVAREFVDRKDPQFILKVIGMLPAQFLLAVLTEKQSSDPTDVLIDHLATKELRAIRASRVDPRDLDQVGFDVDEREGLSTPRTERRQLLSQALEVMFGGSPFLGLEGSIEQTCAKTVNALIKSLQTTAGAFAAAQSAEIFPANIMSRRLEFFRDQLASAFLLPEVVEDGSIDLGELGDRASDLATRVLSLSRIVEQSRRIGDGLQAAENNNNREELSMALERLDVESRDFMLLRDVLEIMAIVLTDVIHMEQDCSPLPRQEGDARSVMPVWWDHLTKKKE